VDDLRLNTDSSSTMMQSNPNIKTVEQIYQMTGNGKQDGGLLGKGQGLDSELASLPKNLQVKFALLK